MDGGGVLTICSQRAEAGRQQGQKLKEVSNIRDAALGTIGES